MYKSGDPTVFGNLKPAPETIEAVQKALLEGKYNGYAPSVGFEEARQAVAKYMEKDGLKLTAKDIILCSGGSSCLDLCITALADGTKNHNILIPRPAFPIYRTLAANVGVAVKRYNLIPENNWEIDLDHLESQIDSNTAAIIITNPSNPCGSNFSEEHLRNVLEICYRRKVPVIADEIYENVVFPGEKFVSTGSLNSGVPILICAGLTKRFLVPGWRMGWIAICDTPNGALEHVRKGLISLSQRILGPNTLIQAALPDILQNTPQSFHDSVISQLKSNVDIMFEKIKQCKGLTPIMPQGALYLTVEIEKSRFPEFKDGMEFTRRMMEEESVFCLPGDVSQIELEI